MRRPAPAPPPAHPTLARATRPPWARLRQAHPARRPAWGGFTLVEVLVALLIMAVIAAMGWQGVSAIARARAHSAEATEQVLRLSAIVGQWEHDLQQLYDGPALGNAQNPSALSFDGAALRLVRRQDAGVQVVVWSLRDGVWMRWASPVLTQQGALRQTWAQAGQLNAGSAGQVRLLDGVAGWQLYYFRDQAWTNAQSTGDLAVTTPANTPPGQGAPAPARVRLPTGVRLQISLPQGPLTRDVLLAPQPP